MGYSAAPLVLGDQMTITRGQLLQFDSANLAPKTLVPYEVNSIRMLAYPSIETAGAAPLANFTGTGLRGFLKWQFLLGILPLTDHYVPMWNMMPVRQSIAELGGYYEWRFKKALLIPPGGRIDAKVQLQATTPNADGTPTITVAVAYAGRLRADLETMPRMIDVPFCSCWDTSDPLAPSANALANDWTTLRNPLKATVEVHSLIARIQNDSTGNDGDDSTEFQIFDPYGRTINRLGTIQFHAEFPTDTREFPYTGDLLPDQHFAVRLSTPPSSTYRPMISYLGSRRERTP
jgi:hypothetical protein